MALIKERNGTRFVNKNYKEDMDYCVKIARVLLIPFGIWPRMGDDSFLSNFTIGIRIVISFALMCSLLVPHFIYTFFDAEDLRRLMKVVAAQVFSTLAVLKFWTFIIKKREIRYCLDVMENDFRDVESEEALVIMRKNAKIERFCTTVYLGLLYGGALPYHIIMPFLEDRIMQPDNTTRIPLPYLTDYIFFDPYVWPTPYYEILFVVQMFVSTVILSTNCGVYSVIASLIMHSCCLFEIVCYKIECLQHESRTMEELTFRVREVVQLHNEAIQYAKRIENTLNIVMLTEMGGCTLIICFLEFGVLQDYEERNTFGMIIYATLMTSILVNVYIISYIGDLLKKQSEEVGQTTYFLEWFKLPKSVMTDFTMIIMRSNQPTKLTAGKMFDLSRQGFFSVVKTSAAYLNFIRTLEL